MAQFRVALGLVLIPLIACRLYAPSEQDGIKARGAKFGDVTVEETKEACYQRCVDTAGCEFWTWYYPTAAAKFVRKCSMYGGEISESRNNDNAITGSIRLSLDNLVNPEAVVDPAIAEAEAAAAAAAAEAAAAAAAAEEEAAAAAAIPIVDPVPQVLPPVEPAVEVLPPPVEPVVEPEQEDLCATVFAGGAAGEFYAGQSLHLTDGEENAAFPRGITNKVSGVRVAAGCRVTLYSKNDFGGEDRTLTEGESNFRENAADRSYNDKASSAKCTCGPACPAGFAQLNDHCYAVFPGKEFETSHPEAKAACQALGADLVAFDTEEEFNQVIAYMKGDGGQTGWWWWTALEIQEESGNFNNGGCRAYKGPSNFKKGKSDCAYLKLADGVMSAKMGSCNVARPYICETGWSRCTDRVYN